MKKEKASSCVGDLNINKKNIEIKVSTGGKDHNKFNYVQIRMNHNCDYILIAYYIDYKNLNILGELFIFELKKKDIKNIILNHGGYAHGTTNNLGVISKEDLDNIKNPKEYVFRPKYGDKCWKDLLNFRVNEISI